MKTGLVVAIVIVVLTGVACGDGTREYIPIYPIEGMTLEETSFCWISAGWGGTNLNEMIRVALKPTTTNYEVKEVYADMQNLRILVIYKNLTKNQDKKK